MILTYHKFQLSYLYESEDDHALSKDVDVTLWQDYRAFNGNKPVKDALDFVIVNNKLHNEFDSFKKSEVPSDISFIETNALLQFYCQEKSIMFTIKQKYGKTYLELSKSNMDDLCKWVQELRSLFNTQGSSVFKNEGMYLLKFHITTKWPAISPYNYIVLLLLLLMGKTG